MSLTGDQGRVTREFPQSMKGEGKQNNGLKCSWNDDFALLMHWEEALGKAVGTHIEVNAVYSVYKGQSQPHWLLFSHIMELEK